MGRGEYSFWTTALFSLRISKHCSDFETSLDTRKPYFAMTDTEKSIADVFQQVWSDYAGRISIDGGSKVLVSDANVANAIYRATEPVRTPYGPEITVARRGVQGEEESRLPDKAKYKNVDSLDFDHYSHAIFGLASEDPKFIMQGLKAMITAMRPKGVAVVISLKTESGQAGADGQVSVSLEDKMQYQSKGKISKLTDVMEYAGFEKGKIRTFDKSTEVGGKKTEAEVVLAMKWDQLSA